MPTDIKFGALHSNGFIGRGVNGFGQKLWIYSTVAAKWVGVQLA